MPISTLPYLETIAAGWFGTIFVGFGFLYFLYPAKALSFFELPYPDQSQQKKTDSTTQPDFKKVIDCMSVVIGARDVFMGVAIYIAAFCGSRQATGWTVIADGFVAFVDGAVCYWMVGKGTANHWNYAPVMMVLGAAMLGGLDWIPLGL